MAIAIFNNLFCVYSPTTKFRSSYYSSIRHSTRLFTRSFAANPQALVDTKSMEPFVVEKEVNKSKSKNLLACPICFDSLIWVGGDPGFSIDSIPGTSLQCSTCKKTYVGNQTHFDLTTASGAKNYGESMPASTELFRLPLISFLYERGWRQGFSLTGGFPGPEKEDHHTVGIDIQGISFHIDIRTYPDLSTSAIAYARNLIKRTAFGFYYISYFQKHIGSLGGNIIDASCASGLFSRLFAKSGLFSSVVALDYSENMLQQCYEFVKQEENFPKENFILVRADISRLPFVSSSVDAVHAGAALHCWPSPSAAVAEISRVLRPGGVFVATTYVLDGPFSFVPFLRALRQNLRQISGSFIFLSEGELEDLCKAGGLIGFSCIRNGPFIMISASKPT